MNHALLFTDADATAASRGEKTQHRILIRTQPEPTETPGEWRLNYRHFSRTNCRILETLNIPAEKLISSETYYVPPEEWLLEGCSYSADDTAWAREAFALIRTYTDSETGYVDGWEDYNGKIPKDSKPPGYDVVVRRNWEVMEPGEIRFHPSVHMPQWASKLKFTIGSVRAQRLQDISEEDAIAEGSLCPPNSFVVNHIPTDPIAEFRSRWDAAKGFGQKWDDNPWVYVLDLIPNKTNKTNNTPQLEEFEAT